MEKQLKVERPLRKNEYELRFATAQAQKGWLNLKATIRGPLAETWEFLTKTPTEKTLNNYPLRADLGFLTYKGKRYERWQHKPTRQGDARIWFFVEGQVVYLEKVFTSHPNQTK